jgi:glycosyltransferase involved in cell wall biosynthesis
MKILILTNKLPFPPRDGGSIATLNMITGLNHAGNRVTCLALNTSKHPYPVEEIPGQLGEQIRFLGVDCDSTIRPMYLVANLLFSSHPYIARRFNIKDFRTALGTLLQEESFDVIQMEGPYPGQYLDLVRRHSHARISLRAHNLEYLIWQRKALHEKSLLKKWYLKNMAGRLKHFELQVARQADFLIPISDRDGSSFRELGLQKPQLTIPAGLVLERYPLTEPPADRSIYFIGALDWLPNQEGLLWFLNHVFDRLLSRLPDLRFHVAGRNAPASFMKKLEHPRITFHGEVEDAVRFMQAYRVMVAPLLTGSGIRIKVLEGMALGRPVITTSAGIEGIPVPDYPGVAVADDPEQFSSQVIRLLDKAADPDLRMKEARLFVSSHFDTFELSERLSRFYTTEA